MKMAKFVETTVNRVYEKRATDKSAWSGRIGMAELSVSAKGGELSFTLNQKVLPESMVNYLLNFSLQSMQDAYAGAETLAEAKANFEKKLDAIQNATVGSRGGNGVSEETIVQRLVAKAAYFASAKVSDADKAKAKEMSDDDANALFDGIFAKNAEKLADAVSAKIEERRIARAKRAVEKAAAAKMSDALDF
jgi:hypothetical protein